ncbi:MAG: lactate racemase domain-containing protein [Elusimicrobiota bacterium]
MSSKEIVLNYKDTVLTDFIPQKAIDSKKFLPILLPKKKPVIKYVDSALEKALEKPTGKSKPLSKIVQDNYRGNDLTIITDDHDRPNVHTRLLLPLLIRQLEDKYKIPKEKIKIVIASGTHRAPTEQELEKILGAGIIGKYRIIPHDCRKNLTEIGEIDGQKISIDSEVFNSDITIPLTDVENHYFAGVAGGPKAFCPGICGIETVTYEHLHMFGPEGFAMNVGLGIMDSNPVFETKKKIVTKILDAIKKQGRDVYTIVSIIDTDEDLVYLEGGELFESHRQAAEVLKDVWTVNVEKRPDIVIAGASVWGVNLYQMGKATHAAYRAVKAGGIILTVAPCHQGWGNEEFKNLMKIGMDELNKHSNKTAAIKKALSKVIEVVSKDFRIGKQKPVDIFQILKHTSWGNMHIIQEGIPESDWNLLPFVFCGKNEEPAQKRLNTWIEKYLGERTITVINNPGYLVKPLL